MEEEVEEAEQVVRGEELRNTDTLPLHFLLRRELRIIIPWRQAMGTSSRVMGAEQTVEP